jgi:serine/threonine protein kinase
VIIQTCDWVNQVKMPSDRSALIDLLNDLKFDISIMHEHGYIHGDILLNNICYDGQKLVIIDHELSLYGRNRLRCTYPWIDLQDLRSGQLSPKTDWLCFKATNLRLLDANAYRQFRNNCENLIRSNTSNFPSQELVH